MDDRRGFLDPYGSFPPGFDHGIARVEAPSHAGRRAAVRGTIVVSGADPIRGARRERHQKGRFDG